MVSPFETHFPKVDRTPYPHWHELKVLLILKSKILLGDPLLVPIWHYQVFPRYLIKLFQSGFLFFWFFFLCLERKYIHIF